jgi:hypothetical protein
MNSVSDTGSMSGDDIAATYAGPNKPSRKGEQ